MHCHYTTRNSEYHLTDVGGKKQLRLNGHFHNHAQFNTIDNATFIHRYQQAFLVSHTTGAGIFKPWLLLTNAGVSLFAYLLT